MKRKEKKRKKGSDLGRAVKMWKEEWPPYDDDWGEGFLGRDHTSSDYCHLLDKLLFRCHLLVILCPLSPLIFNSITVCNLGISSTPILCLKLRFFFLNTMFDQKGKYIYIKGFLGSPKRGENRIEKSKQMKRSSGDYY